MSVSIFLFNLSFKFLYLISLFLFLENIKIAKRMYIPQDQCKKCQGWEEERRVASVKTDNKTAGAHHYRSKCNSLNKLQKPHNAHYHVNIPALERELEQMRHKHRPSRE